VCPCGERLEPGERQGDKIVIHCTVCNWESAFDESDWEAVEK
jgi:hypothetical protein